MKPRRPLAWRRLEGQPLVSNETVEDLQAANALRLGRTTDIITIIGDSNALTCGDVHAQRLFQPCAQGLAISGAPTGDTDAEAATAAEKAFLSRVWLAGACVDRLDDSLVRVDACLPQCQ